MLAEGCPRRHVHHQMDTYRAPFNCEARGEQVASKASTRTSIPAAQAGDGCPRGQHGGGPRDGGEREQGVLALSFECLVGAGMNNEDAARRSRNQEGGDHKESRRGGDQEKAENPAQNARLLGIALRRREDWDRGRRMCRWASIVVGGMMDGAEPQPAQTFKPAGFLGWVRAGWVMQPLSGLEMVRAG